MTVTKTVAANGFFATYEGTLAEVRVALDADQVPGHKVQLHVYWDSNANAENAVAWVALKE